MKITNHAETEKLTGANIETNLEWVGFFSEAQHLAALARARRAAKQQASKAQ